MKRLVMIVATLTIITGVFLCTNTTYATNKAIDNETESKIVEIKENAANCRASSFRSSISSLTHNRTWS